MDEISFGPKRDFRWRSPRGPHLVAAAILLALAGILVAVHFRGHPAPVPPPAPKPKLLRVRVLARVPLPILQSTGMVRIGRVIWLANWYNGKVVAVDLKTRRITHVLQIGTAQNGPISIAAGAGSLWVLNFATGHLLRVAADSGLVIARIRVPGEATDVTFARGAAWVVTSLAGTEQLDKINPASGSILGRAAISRGFGCAAFPGPQGIWVGCSASNSLRLVSQASARPVRRVPIPASGDRPQVVATARALWLLAGRQLMRLGVNSTRFSAVAALVQLSEQAASPAVAVDSAGRVWVAGDQLEVLLAGDRTFHRVTGTGNLSAIVSAGRQVWAQIGSTLTELALR